jgi:hypothetical protein
MAHVLNIEVRVPELRGHLIEFIGESFKFIAGSYFDAMIQVAGANLGSPLPKYAQWPHHAKADNEACQHSYAQANEKENARAEKRRVKGSICLGHGTLDKHEPLELWDRRVGREDFLAGIV